MTKTKRKEKEKKVRKKKGALNHWTPRYGTEKKSKIETHMGKVEIKRQLSSKASCEL